jgi:hypothetical protein
LLVSAISPLLRARRSFEIIMDNKDAEPSVETGRPQVSTVKGEAMNAVDMVGEGKVTARLDRIAGIVEGIDKLVKETRLGVVVAIFATLATAIAIVSETWIGPVGVIIAIFLIAVVFAVILLYLFKWRR